MDGAFLKPCCRRTEDEVGGAFYVAMVEQKACVCQTCIDCVLIAKETAVDELQTVALCVQCHCLTQSGGIVLYGDILQGNVVGIDS